MKPYTNEDPQFSETINIYENTDPGNADEVLNKPLKQLHDNTLKNKKEIEEGDSQNRTVTFTSGDIEDGEGGDTVADQWTDVQPIVNGEKHKSLFRKISTMMKNVRYLYNVLGSEDISQIADGTVTGIVAALKQAAFFNPTNNLLATIPGTSLDAVQGRVLKEDQYDLKDQITQINSDLAVKILSNSELKEYVRSYGYKIFFFSCSGTFGISFPAYARGCAQIYTKLTGDVSNIYIRKYIDGVFYGEW